MQNKFIKKYAFLAVFGLIFYSNVAFAVVARDGMGDEGQGIKPQGGEMETENENESDEGKMDDRKEDRKLRQDNKIEDRELKIDEKKNKIEKRVGDKKIKVEERIIDKKVELDKKREEMLKNVLEKRKEFELKKEELKTEMKTKKDEARETLNKTLGVIKDEKKKASIENIANIIDNTNKNTSTRFTNSVNSIENVLVSVKSRSEKVKVGGTDISAVLVDIAAAENLIAEARTAISVQSAKVYTIDITDPAKAKEIMKATRNTFYTDIKAVQEKVKIARDSIKKIADGLKKITPKETQVVSPAVTDQGVNAATQ